MTTATIAAILVNYNAGPELRRALQSIADELGDGDWEAFVVDNASSDGSERIAAEFSRAHLICNDTNVGFARGVNQALARTSAPVVLIMNPDCRLAPGALTTMQAELFSHPTCALVGPRILDPDGSEQGSARGDPDMLTIFVTPSSDASRMVLRISATWASPSVGCSGQAEQFSAAIRSPRLVKARWNAARLPLSSSSSSMRRCGALDWPPVAISMAVAPTRAATSSASSNVWSGSESV